MGGPRLSQIPVGVPTDLGDGLALPPHFPSQECGGGHSLAPSLVASTPLPPLQGPRKVCEEHPQLEGLVSKTPRALGHCHSGMEEEESLRPQAPMDRTRDVEVKGLQCVLQ